MNSLVTRTVSGTVFCAVMIAGMLFPVVYPALLIVIMYACMSEFYKMSMGDCYKLEQKFATLSAFLLFMAVYLHLAKGLDIRWAMAAAVPLSGLMISTVVRSDRPVFERYPYLFAGMLYIGLPMALSPIVMYHVPGEFDGWLMLDFFIIIWAADVGAYCIGTMFGQKPTSKKLAPKISPKKSWWGFWAAIVFGITAGVVLNLIGVLRFGMLHCVALGIIISAGSVAGDLVESVWKRYFGVKDSGNAIPGHGGFLDRFDSSIVAIPLATAYLVLTNLI